MPYVPHTEADIAKMLSTIGVGSVDDLFSGIPSSVRLNAPLAIPPPLPEIDLMRHMQELADKNDVRGSLTFLGAGLYRHFCPAAVTELAMRSEFLTPYTPYQPEISQGTLQVIFEYQSMICRIFGMDVSNASLYDGSTAVAEAALMALRIKKDRKTILMCEALHPEYREVTKTVVTQAGTKLVTLPTEQGVLNRAALRDHLDNDVAALIVSYPNFFGAVEDFSEVAKQVHDKGVLFIVAVPEPLALGLLTPPGEWGADIVVAEGSSFGLALNFGGPALGIFTCREEYIRSMPGRVCGETVDLDGKRGYVLTLSTREQHIRRERATSNICTNQAHCATIATLWLAMMGRDGFAELSRLNALRADYAKRELASIPGVTLPFPSPTFNEFVIEFPRSATDVLEKLDRQHIHGGIALSRWFPKFDRSALVCVTEMHTKEEIDRYVAALRAIL